MSEKIPTNPTPENNTLENPGRRMFLKQAAKKTLGVVGVGLTPPKIVQNLGEKFYSLALELSGREKTFDFPGILPEFYNQLKADEEEFPGYGTPIDGLIERFKMEGMKVVLGKNPQSGNIFILPGKSTDIENDSIQPKNIILNDTLNEKIKELISIAKQLHLSHTSTNS